MSGEDSRDPQKLTFSQAYGYEELPGPLQLEELSAEARTKLWSMLYYCVHTTRSGSFVDGRWENILQMLHLHFHVLPLDEFNDKFLYFTNVYKPFFMSQKFNRVFDLLQTIMRHQQCPNDFIKSVAIVFEQCRLAYVLDTRPPVTIYPAATEEEGRAVIQTTEELTKTGFTSAVTHLRQASDCINQRDYPGAVRESIHAVESTARQVDPNARTLEPALKTLEKAGALHPALKQAFSNLYGYTSDEQGIRHALINNPQPNVGQDEAVFMLGACASFSSYLARKHQRPEL